MKFFNIFKRKPSMQEGEIITSGSTAAAGARMWRRQALEATLIKACKHCQAPGRFMSEDRIKEGWPGAYVENIDERNGKPVGKTCPNCGKKRPGNKALGEIWIKEHR